MFEIGAVIAVTGGARAACVGMLGAAACGDFGTCIGDLERCQRFRAGGGLGAAIPCGIAGAAMAFATGNDAERPLGLGLGAALALGSSGWPDSPVAFGCTGGTGIALASGSSGWPDSPLALAGVAQELWS